MIQYSQCHCWYHHKCHCWYHHKCHCWYHHNCHCWCHHKCHCWYHHKCHCWYHHKCIPVPESEKWEELPFVCCAQDKTTVHRTVLNITLLTNLSLLSDSPWRCTVKLDDVISLRPTYWLTSTYPGDKPHGNSHDPDSADVRCRGETMEKIGTLLGPLIFLAYVNSAARSAASKHWKFVDDLNLLETRNPTSSPSNMQQDLNELSLWSQAGHMKLHPKKCKVLHIQFRKIPVTPSSLTVNNIEVHQVKVLRVLGVIFQADLKWNSHVDSVCTKAYQRLYFLRKLKHFHLTTDDLLTVYTSYIRPILEYAAPVCHSGLPNKLNDRIEEVQRRALRVILGAEYTSYAAACSHLGLPTLSSRRRTLTETFAKSLLHSGQLQHILPPTRGTVSGQELPLAVHPANLKQVNNKRYRETKKRRGGMPAPGNNGTDHIQQLEAPDGHPFARQVIRGYNNCKSSITSEDLDRAEAQRLQLGLLFMTDMDAAEGMKEAVILVVDDIRARVNKVPSAADIHIHSGDCDGSPEGALQAFRDLDNRFVINALDKLILVTRHIPQTAVHNTAWLKDVTQSENKDNSLKVNPNTRCFVFVTYYFLAALVYILSAVDIRKCFQQKNLDLTEIQRAVEAKKEVLRLAREEPLDQHLGPEGRLHGMDIQEFAVLRRQFVDFVIENLEDRFPQMDLLSAFSFLDPSHLPV
ncbi:hypothetical protein Bbelb_290770 [Branchiostoma belcheri]|nr:hypothetical protein Bbelb_290770 [Branchiostoma belcheri]